MLFNKYLTNTYNYACSNERNMFARKELDRLLLSFLCEHHYATYGTISYYLVNEMPSQDNTSVKVLKRLVREGYIVSLSVNGELVYNDKTVYALTAKGLSCIRPSVSNDVYLSCKRSLKTLHNDGNAKYAAHGALACYTVMQISDYADDCQIWYEVPIRNIFTSSKRIVSNTPFTDAVIKLDDQNYVCIEQDMNTCINKDIYQKIMRYYYAGTIGFEQNSGMTTRNAAILFSCHDKKSVSRLPEVSVSLANKVLSMVDVSKPFSELANELDRCGADDKAVNAMSVLLAFYAEIGSDRSIQDVLNEHICTLKHGSNPLKHQLIAENELKSVNGRMKYLVNSLLDLLSRAEEDAVLLTERTVVLKILDGAAFTCVPSLLVSKFYNGGLIGLMKDTEYIRKLSINAIYAYTDADELSEVPHSNECSFVNFAMEASFEANGLPLTMRNSVLVRYPGLKTVGMYVHIEDLSDVFAWIRAVIYLRYSELSLVRSRLLLIATEDEARRFAEIVGNGGYSGEDMYAGGGRAGNGRFCFVSREDFLSCSEDNACFYLPNDEPLYF